MGTGEAPGNVDHLRGLTVCLDNSEGTEAVERDVMLCPGARVYGYSFCVRIPTADPIPEIAATLKLQDARIEVPSCGCRTPSLAHDLPGLAWPSFAKLVAPPGSAVCLVLTYGNCA